MNWQRLLTNFYGHVAKLMRGAGGSVVFWLVVGVTANASAQSTERRILGHTLAEPLASSAEPAVARTLADLRAMASQTGTVRVIVGLRVPFAGEGLLGVTEAAQQRSEIAAANSSLLRSIPKLGVKTGRIKTFESIPFMALEVDGNELEELASLTNVTSIEEDKLMTASLAESVPLIGGSTAWASGYTGAGRTVAQCTAQLHACVLAKRPALVTDVTCEHRHCHTNCMRDLLRIHRNPERRQCIKSQAHTDGPSLQYGHEIDQNKEHCRTMYGLLALLKHKEPGQHKSGNHPGDVGKDDS